MDGYGCGFQIASHSRFTTHFLDRQILSPVEDHVEVDVHDVAVLHVHQNVLSVTIT